MLLRLLHVYGFLKIWLHHVYLTSMFLTIEYFNYTSNLDTGTCPNSVDTATE
jgi:hypothetical protein